LESVELKDLEVLATRKILRDHADKPSSGLSSKGGRMRENLGAPTTSYALMKLLNVTTEQPAFNSASC